MSPEQASSNAIDHRSDVYAFGVLAYETLTGRLPFDGDTPLATLMKHQSDAPLPPRRLRPELPPEVEQIVLRALVKRPEGRQQSMDELAGALSRLAAADPDVLRAPVFGTAVSPLLTGRASNRSTDRATDRLSERMSERTSSRGGTLPLGDTLPLRDLAPPAPVAAPTRPSTRIRRDTRSEVEVVSRRRSQLALAAVLGLLFVALLSGVVAALAVRRADVPASYVPPTRNAEIAPRPEPPAVRVTAPDPEPPAEAALAPLEPPPSVSAAAPPAPRPARSRPARAPGVGAKAGSRENGPSGNDLLDPYGPTAR